MLVEMLSRFAPTHADLGQVQPIVCINCSDTPAGLPQPLRNLFSDKAFAAGIDAANPDKDGRLGRRDFAFSNDSRNERLKSLQTCVGIDSARFVRAIDASVASSLVRRTCIRSSK